MSDNPWQAYVDEQLMVELPSGGSLSHAAIIGADGSLWAGSAAFPTVDAGQLSTVFDAMTSEDRVRQLGSTGILIGDMKFQIVASQAGDDPKACFIYGRSSAHGGLCVKKTNTALVIGIYPANVSKGDANLIVENLGDYLIESDY